MAYSQPEFALGHMHRDPSPLPATLRELRTRMHALETRIINNPASVTAVEYVQLHRWRRVCRQQRQIRADLTDAIAEPRGGMHAGCKAGERFVEPVRRDERRRARFSRS